MSASIDAVSGAHSGGLATTVLPAASAGPIRQVASISGAFQGVITAVDPGRVVGDPLAVPADLAVRMVQAAAAMSAKKRKFIPTRGMTLRRCDRSSDPLSRVSTSGEFLGPLVDPVRHAVQDVGALVAGQRRPGREGLLRRGDRGIRPRLRRPPHISAMGCSSMGETSVKVRARRRPADRRSSAGCRPRRPRPYR